MDAAPVRPQTKDPGTANCPAISATAADAADGVGPTSADGRG